MHFRCQFVDSLAIGYVDLCYVGNASYSFCWPIVFVKVNYLLQKKISFTPELNEQLLISVIPKLQTTPVVANAMEYISEKREKDPDASIRNLQVFQSKGNTLCDVQFVTETESKGLLCLYDTDKHLILQEIIQPEIGANAYTLNLSGYPKGHYLVKVCTENHIYLGAISR